MITLRILIFSVFISTISIPALIAQEAGDPPIRELGIGIRNFSNDFSLIYKKQKEGDTYIRYEGNLNLIYEQGILVLNLGVQFALEKRKYVGENLKFVRGPGVGLSVLLSSTEAGINRVTPSFNYQLGFQYDINDNFYVGASTFPTAFLSITDAGDSSLGFGINANLSAQVSAVFRF